LCFNNAHPLLQRHNQEVTAYDQQTCRFFSPLGKLAGKAILLALISFFLSFLMIARRTIISGSTGTIFAIYSPNESVLSADDQSDLFFRCLKGTLPRQPIFWKNGKLPHSSLWHSKTKWDIATSMCPLAA